MGGGGLCVPSCSFGEGGGLDQRGRDPGLGEVGRWETAHGLRSPGRLESWWR